jgi:hypothetical protein
MTEELRELYDEIGALRSGVIRAIKKAATLDLPEDRGARPALRVMVQRLNNLLAELRDVPAWAPAAPTTVTERLEEAIALRPLGGDPGDGPYPVSVEDVAAEIHAFLLHLENESATGLLDALLPGLLSLQRERRWEAARARLQPLLDELTINLLIPELREAGVENPEQYRLDYDMSPITPRSNIDPFEDGE